MTLLKSAITEEALTRLGVAKRDPIAIHSKIRGGALDQGPIAAAVLRPNNRRKLVKERR